MLVPCYKFNFLVNFFQYKKQSLESGLFWLGLRPRGGCYSFTEVSALNSFHTGEEGRRGRTLPSLPTRLCNFLLWSIEAFSCLLFYSALRNTLWDRWCCHLTDEETEAQSGRATDLCKVPRIRTCACLMPKPVLCSPGQDLLGFGRLLTANICHMYLCFIYWLRYIFKSTLFFLVLHKHIVKKIISNLQSRG